MWNLILVLTTSVATATHPGLADGKQPALLTAKRMVAADGATPLRKLLVERYNAALAEVQKRHQVSSVAPSPTFDIEPLCRAAERLRKAGVEAATTPDEVVKFREADVELAKHVEAIADVANRAGVARTAADIELARFHRADAEIELLRAKKAAEKK